MKKVLLALLATTLISTPILADTPPAPEEIAAIDTSEMSIEDLRTAYDDLSFYYSQLYDLYSEASSSNALGALPEATVASEPTSLGVQQTDPVAMEIIKIEQGHEIDGHEPDDDDCILLAITLDVANITDEEIRVGPAFNEADSFVDGYKAESDFEWELSGKLLPGKHLIGKMFYVVPEDWSVFEFYWVQDRHAPIDERIAFVFTSDMAEMVG